MAIWIEEDAKVLVQGITGKQGMFHAGKMVEYGTNLVGGVTPGKGGQEVLGLPVFNSMIEACLLYTSPSPRDKRQSRMPSSA